MSSCSWGFYPDLPTPKTRESLSTASLTALPGEKFTGINILGASSGEEALARLRQEAIGVMLSDLRMPGLSGLDLLPKALGISPHLCVIMLTGYATVDNAVNALKEGAWDFITKPVEREALFHTVEKSVAHYSLATENKRLTEMIRKFTADRSIHVESHEMKQLMEKVTAISATDYTVLITGESGSGKEYVARIIHRLSKRKAKSCHALNCPAIPEQLLESELFGHVKGSFTGAERNREGFFMSADKGTPILDEIGDISLPIQAKFLKFLQDKEVKPVGSSTSKTADVRIIALTKDERTRNLPILSTPKVPEKLKQVIY
ncbi:MAG: sigma-54-dependent Fis family transcriptional regulator [Desulfobacteraceae bacterium]|nr:sigma-54-dependent Fis family transcriptional regulator [Desulfobacteraceae bacterium]